MTTAKQAKELAERIVMAMYFPHGVRNMEENSLAREQAVMVEKLLAAALAACALEEAKWWHDYFLGKPQSGKLGVERLAEPRERLRALKQAAGGK